MLWALQQNKELIIESYHDKVGGRPVTVLKTHEHRLILHNLCPKARSSGEGVQGSKEGKEKTSQSYPCCPSLCSPQRLSESAEDFKKAAFLTYCAAVEFFNYYF